MEFWKLSIILHTIYTGKFFHFLPCHYLEWVCCEIFVSASLIESFERPICWDNLRENFIGLLC